MTPTSKTPRTETVRLSHSTDLLRRALLSHNGVSLIIYHRDGTQLVSLSGGDPVVVGRMPPAEVVVPDKSLSRVHARFMLEEDDGVTVEDLGSTNGTWIGGECIERATVRPGAGVTLGSIHVAVHARTAAGAQFLGLSSHDQFIASLEDELVRARHFRRAAAVVMVRALGKADVHLHRWAPALQDSLRSVDRLALYSNDAVEVLLPETTADQAAAVAAELLREHGDQPPKLVSGVGAFPESATSAEGLLEACRSAALMAGEDQDVWVARPASTVMLPRPASGADAATGPIAESPAMKEALTMARRLARGVIPVLLHGETGTGKEVVARFIHEHGPRADKPMVSVNCAAIPSQLVESTLFGHEKGAFTGASKQHKGVFEAAAGGTVLLDEIGELPATAQAVLLRVLESKKVTRVGSTVETPVDVRIMAASHRDLEVLSESGDFRQDLLYRLNALTLKIPPLRDRSEDIGALARHFLRLANESNGRQIAEIDSRALAALHAYHWPGNVRELRNVMDRAVVLAEQDVIGLCDLPMAVRLAAPESGDHGERSPGAAGASGDDEREAGRAAVAATPSRAAGVALRQEGEDFRSCMERLEVQVLLDALREADGNQTETARLLQMPRRTLVYKIRVHGIRKLGYGTGDGESGSGEDVVG